MKQPDPKAHLYISLVKSTIRIFAGTVLIFGFMPQAGALLIVAEIVGIVEELV